LKYKKEKKMAKKYLKFPELADMGIGTVKPSGTLGKHRLIILNKEGNAFLVQGIMSSGKKTAVKKVFPKETLGYNCGSIWVLREPQTKLEKFRAKYHMGVRVEDIDLYVGKETEMYHRLIIRDDGLIDCWGTATGETPVIIIMRNSDSPAIAEINIKYRRKGFALLNKFVERWNENNGISSLREASYEACRETIAKKRREQVDLKLSSLRQQGVEVITPETIAKKIVQYQPYWDKDFGGMIKPKGHPFDSDIPTLICKHSIWKGLLNTRRPYVHNGSEIRKFSEHSEANGVMVNLAITPEFVWQTWQYYLKELK
jgi:hypothetical protein